MRLNTKKINFRNLGVFYEIKLSRNFFFEISTIFLEINKYYNDLKFEYKEE